MFLVAKTSIDFLQPWCGFAPGQGEAFLRELKNELARDHPAHPRKRCSGLYNRARVSDAGLDRIPIGAVVLTEKSRAEQPG